MTRRYSHGREWWLLAILAVMAGGACNGGRPNVGLDETPPELAFASEVPLYTREMSATLAMSAKDPSGVAKVWCQVGNGGSAVAAERKDDGNYSCGVALEHNTANAVVIWATDGAQNSGEGRDPPYMLVRAIVQAENALAVSLNGAAPATYYDESTMTVGTEVPPVYARNGAGFVVVTAGTTIHKAATRLASPTTGPGDLEEKNPDNLPWLQFAVSLTGAPVEAASYTIEAKSEGKTKTYSGDLITWRSPQIADGATSGNVYFNLPLDLERIPMLATAAAPVALKVAVALTDEVGNKGGAEVELKYEVIGPPLNIVVDSEYPKRSEPDSTHHYKIADKNYETLFDGGDYVKFGGTQQVRLVRIVVTNPATQPVALDVSSIAGSWSMSETWSGHQRAEGTAVFNDSTCPPDNNPAKNHATMYAAVGGSLKETRPEVASVGWKSVAATSNLATLAELRDGSAVVKVGASYIVPAAEGSAPGVVSLYVTRPLTVSRAGAPALRPPPATNAMDPAPYTNDMGTLYTYARETKASISCCQQGFMPSVYYKYHLSVFGGMMERDYCSLEARSDAGLSRMGLGTYCEPGPVPCPLKDGWLGTNVGSGRPCGYCMGTCSCASWTQAQTYNTSTYCQQLSAASETVAGSFMPITQPIDDAGNMYGVANEAEASIAVNEKFTHY